MPSEPYAKAQVRPLLEATGFVAADLGALDVRGPASLAFGAPATQNFVRI